MIDIVRVEDGQDLGFADTAVIKAANVVSVQLGSLEYAPQFGADLNYFLTSGFQIQTASFKAYLIQRLTESQINVSDCIETIESLVSKFSFYVSSANEESQEGLIA